MQHADVVAMGSGSTEPEPLGAHHAAVIDRLDQLDAATANWESQLAAVTALLLDALLAGDTDALAAVSDPLRDRLARLDGQLTSTPEARGWLTALLSLTRSALTRLPSSEELQLRQNTHAWRFLSALCDSGASSAGLRHELDLDDTQVSRIGRDLLGRGLVVQRRVGREALWELSPRGKQLLRKLNKQSEHRDYGGNGAGASSRTRQRAQPERAGAGGRASARGGATATGNARMLRQANGGTGARAASGDEIRYVAKREVGGWQISTNQGRKARESFDTKAQALERAKQIVARAGGGYVITIGDNGTETRHPVPRAQRS